jgi:glyoxylate reductase
MFKVYLTSLYPETAVERIAKVAVIKQWKESTTVPYGVLKEEIKDVDGLFCFAADKVDVGIIQAAHKLKVISNDAVGFNNIDIAEATRCGIAVGNTPGVLTESTADLTFALLMAAARRVAESDRYVRSGQWQSLFQPGQMFGWDIHEATLGIVGLGRIGIAVARRARGFNMRVLYSNRTRRPEIEAELGLQYVSLGSLLARSDFISLHVALNEDTRHMIGRAELASMKPNAILINAARGAVVDQKALYDALKEGQIAGAGLDVLEIEPIPLVDPLLTLENVVLTPHIGSATTVTRTRMALLAAENLIAGLEGRRLPHCVNPEVYRD